MISIGVGALGRVSTGLEKGLEKLEIRGRIETIPTTELSISARKVRETRRLVSKIPVSELQLTLKWKSRIDLSISNNNNNNNNNTQLIEEGDPLGIRQEIEI